MSKSFYSRFSFGKLCKTQQMFERAGEYYTEQRTQIVHGRRRVGGGGGTEHENVEALVLMRNRRHTQWTQKTVSLAICVLQRIQMDGGEGDYAAGLLFQSLF